MLNNLLLPHDLKVALHEAGYKHLDDLRDTNETDLAIELNITQDQARAILSEPIRPTIKSSTAADLLSTSRPCFTTSSPLDAILGNVTPGSMVEISSPPGGGKTSVAIAMALSAAESGEVLVVDTEGGITPTRLGGSPAIHLVRIATQAQMVAFLHELDDWLEQHPAVHLVVVDTLSCHFRQPNLDMASRRRAMDMVKQKFAKATAVHQCAVVVTNQLATKLLTAENKPANFDTGDRAVLMPQLGESWTTSRTVRLVLFRGRDDLRYAHASTTSDHEPWTRFDINGEGRCI